MNLLLTERRNGDMKLGLSSFSTVFSQPIEIVRLRPVMRLALKSQVWDQCGIFSSAPQ